MNHATKRQYVIWCQHLKAYWVSQSRYTTDIYNATRFDSRGASHKAIDRILENYPNHGHLFGLKCHVLEQSTVSD